MGKKKKGFQANFQQLTESRKYKKREPNSKKVVVKGLVILINEDEEKDCKEAFRISNT